MEGSAWGALSLWRWEWTTFTDVRGEREEVSLLSQRSPYALLRASVATSGIQPPRGMELEVLHPYLGFVRKPTVKVGSGAYYGFEEGPDTWVEPKKKDTVVIGIFGGSIAQQFYYEGTEELTKQLKSDSFFSGKKIITKLLALPGYKQPQQLLAFNYYLSLGGHLDIAVNLDGVNELILPSYENIPKGVFPFYPRSWFFRIQPEERADIFPLIGQISYLMQKRSEWAHWLALFPMRSSMTAGVFWRIGDAYLARKITRREEMLVATQPRKAEEYIITGPHRPYPSKKEALIDVIDYWKRSSLLMHRVSLANGIRYFHFLQPNGRIEHSKPFTEEEKEYVLSDAHFPPATLTRTGYPLLRNAGKELFHMGVHFADISMVFRDVKETLYIDGSHVNRKGSEIMAREIAEVIRKNSGLK